MGCHLLNQSDIHNVSQCCQLQQCFDYIYKLFKVIQLSHLQSDELNINSTNLNLAINAAVLLSNFESSIGISMIIWIKFQNANVLNGIIRLLPKHTYEIEHD